MEAPENFAESSEVREIGEDQLQNMLNQMEELFREGRTEEAERMLNELRSMMDNMMSARPSQRGRSDATRNSIRELQDTMRQQQGLVDEAFRDLLEQQGQDLAGRSEGNQGFSGGLGRGQDHYGKGTGQSGSSGSETLADRQETLRQTLRRQMRELAQMGRSQGDNAHDSLEDAARSMTGARDQLRKDNLDSAIREQERAMASLAEGIRSLSEGSAENREDGYGGPPGTGQTMVDPLGRTRSGSGGVPGRHTVSSRGVDPPQIIRNQGGNQASRRGYLERVRGNRVFAPSLEQVLITHLGRESNFC